MIYLLILQLTMAQEPGGEPEQVEAPTAAEGITPDEPLDGTPPEQPAQPDAETTPNLTTETPPALGVAPPAQAEQNKPVQNKPIQNKPVQGKPVKKQPTQNTVVSNQPKMGQEMSFNILYVALFINLIFIVLIAGIGKKNMSELRKRKQEIEMELQKIKKEMLDYRTQMLKLRESYDSLKSELKVLNSKVEENIHPIKMTDLNRQPEIRSGLPIAAQMGSEESQAQTETAAPLKQQPSKRAIKLPKSFSQLTNALNQLCIEHASSINELGAHGDHFKASVLNNIDFYTMEFSKPLSDQTKDTLAIPLIDEILQFYSLIRRWESNEPKFSVLSQSLNLLVYTHFNAGFQREGWGQLMTVVPFETMVDYDFHNVVGTEALPEPFHNQVVHIYKVGVLSIDGRSIIRKSEVKVGAK